MILYFDIDGTICDTKGGDYLNAKPIRSRINRINELAKDNTVVLWTARGALSGINWMVETQNQLEEWGVVYHKLMEKPYFDLVIDDKAMDANDYFNVN
jgi:CMP-N,N'-diacetyllegionaminic acid synthase